MHIIAWKMIYNGNDFINILPIKRYNSLDALIFSFKASPYCLTLYAVVMLMRALIPTAFTALATSSFVDTAVAILQGNRPRDAIYAPLVVLLAVLGVASVISSVGDLLFARVEMNLRLKIKPMFVEKHAALEYRHIESADSRELVSRVSRDPVGEIMRAVNSYAYMMVFLVGIFSVLMLIVTQVWWAALVIAAFSVPLFMVSIRAGRKNYAAWRDTEKYKRRADYLDEVLTGRDSVEERTLFGYGDILSKRWRELYETWRVMELKVSAKYFFVSKGLSMILALIAVLIALTLISPVVGGELSVGMYMGIISAVFAMIRSFGFIVANSLDTIAHTGEYMKDVTDFAALSDAGEALAKPDSAPPAFSELEFKDVRFKYPTGDEYVLDGISFKLKHGRHYAFVGRNGAGKTTITKLLTGLYTDYEGEIFINGKELRTYPMSTLKSMFSVVYQDFAKYYISFKENISIGDIGRDVPADEVVSMANDSGLGVLIAEMNDGINTPLEKILPDGQDISGGQWQRVAITRSLISRAPVKMLDEPTAALDPVSESRIYEEFEKLMRGHTTVFISHRLGSTKLADEILVIDGGRISERGTHTELMSAGGQYAAMFDSQRRWYL